MKKIITSGAIIVDESKRILLVLRPSDKKLFPSCWAIPGGKNEDNESLEQTLQRELKEETGLDAISWDKYTFTEYLTEDSHNISHIYRVERKGRIEPKTSAEWFSYDALQAISLSFNQGELFKDLFDKGLMR